MSIGNRLKDLAVSDSGFVFDPHTGSTFSINATGLAIVEGLKQDLGREALIALLRERFETLDEDLPRDVDEFMGLLRQQNLIAPQTES